MIFYSINLSFFSQAIFDLLGEDKRSVNPDTRVDQIFQKMDANGDGKLSREEFVTGCLQDDHLRKMLAPSAS
jgi:Ca2+-binding EF-hand superfamily protein